MSLRLLAPSTEPWLTYDELAEKMGCSTKTLERLKAKGMPYIPIGRRPLIRFIESEAKRWALEQGMMPSPTRRDG